MNTANTALSLTAISSLLSLLGIAYLAFWRFRPLCMDLFRQNMFDLRDELFDYAAAGNIEFTHPAYGILRSTLNGHIRFAHHLNLWQGVIVVAFSSKEDREYLKRRSFLDQWEPAISGLDPIVKKQLETFRERMQHSAVFYFMITSPLSIVLVVLALVITLCRDPKLRAEIKSRASVKIEEKKIHDSFPTKTVAVLHETKNTETWQMKQVFSEVALIYGETPSQSAEAALSRV